MSKDQLPDDADAEFKKVMKVLRSGRNLDHIKRERMTAQQRKAVDKAKRAAERKRKGGRHRAGGGDDVINTGMFD